MFERLRAAGFDLLARNHAEAILRGDFAPQTEELVEALLGFSIPAAELIASGGGEAASTQRLRRRLAASGWRKHNFVLETKIDGAVRESISHEIDHVRRARRGVLALEIEWNNKDPFFDRDLENFQRLHAQSVISVGVIVTRGAALQAGLRRIVASFVRGLGARDEAPLAALGMKDRTRRQREAVARAVAAGFPFADAFARQFTADKYGPSTTHWAKLAERIDRGVGAPCPLLLAGLPLAAIRDASPPDEEPRLDLGEPG